MKHKDLKFTIDKQSVHDAERMVSALRVQNTHLLTERVTDRLKSFFQGHREPDSQSSFSSPLKPMANEIPMHDIEVDLEDFGTLAMVMKWADLSIPVRQMSDGSLVPLLPPLGSLDNQSYDPYKVLARKNPRTFASTLFALLNNPPQVILPWAEVQDLFFDGLQSFIAARLSGFRWAQGLARVRESTTPNAAKNSGLGLKNASDSFQLWTVATSTPGLSVYYGGTHAIRSSGIYLNGLTAAATPLDVYLPMGTLYLAANSAPGGGLTWDDKNGHLVVPSFTPTYSTKAF